MSGAESEAGKEIGQAKPSVLSHTGLMTVIAAAISALAAVGVAYIQKSGPAEKPAEASVGAAPANAAAFAAPVYVTKVVNGKTVKVLVRTAQAGKAAAGNSAATPGDAGQMAANDAVTSHEGHTAAQPEHSPGDAAEPAPDAPADSSDEGQ